MQDLHLVSARPSHDFGPDGAAEPTMHGVPRWNLPRWDQPVGVQSLPSELAPSHWYTDLVLPFVELLAWFPKELAEKPPSGAFAASVSLLIEKRSFVLKP